MNKTKIDWCDSTWNPVTGCLHGCEYCYARGIANRFGANIGIKPEEKFVLDEPYCVYGRKLPYPYGFAPTFHRYHLNDYTAKKGRNIFVCSMADLFGKWVPDSWIEEVFKACEKAPQHNYIFLTKNAERYVELQNFDNLMIKNNMWYGTTIANKKNIEPAKGMFYLDNNAKTFLSIEPLLENITKDDFWIALCKSVNWVIIGAETGRRKDKVIPERKWIENIVNDCKKEDIPVFMKSILADIWGEPLIQEFPKELKR